MCRFISMIKLIFYIFLSVYIVGMFSTIGAMNVTGFM